MAHLVISYDLHQQRAYKPVWDYLEGIGAVRLLESLWVVTTSKTPAMVRDDLKAKGDSDDSFAVLELKSGSGWATINAKAAGVAWLRANILA